MRDVHFLRISVEKQFIKCIKFVGEKNQPSHSVLYSARPKSKEFVETKIKKMLSQKIVYSAKTKQAPPTVSASKHDGTLGICVDYRKHDAIRKQGLSPIPQKIECINSLGEAAVLFILNANRGYCLVEIADADRNKSHLLPTMIITGLSVGRLS